MKVEKIILEPLKTKIINTLVKQFADQDKKNHGLLIWNSIREKPTCYYNYELFKLIPRILDKSDQEVYIYHERSKELFSLKFQYIIEILNEIELDNMDTSQYDACVFDSEYKWLIAITHEDAVLTIGLE
jgi:hypothetical protein